MLNFRFDSLTSLDLSNRFPESLAKSATTNLVGCIDYEAGLLFADKALLALWVITQLIFEWANESLLRSFLQVDLHKCNISFHTGLGCNKK